MAFAPGLFTDTTTTTPQRRSIGEAAAVGFDLPAAPLAAGRALGAADARAGLGQLRRDLGAPLALRDPRDAMVALPRRAWAGAAPAA